MSNLAIRIENLGKMYRIGGPQEKYSTLRDTVTHAISAPFSRVRSLLRGEAASGLKEEIWALKDVSFEVNHGEVVGIIGRNGAGKSTLLKILSRITEPTTGYADVYGRVGALLEVGTGFHPELTGRENIYLNGAILGMTRWDIDHKFDEIVDFAGVERFIDTPVKHYSSGMGLRLGFAVAAHLEPEILVVDEVLAVGDAQFQRKCLNKMSAVAGDGRTVLFVSHNMAAVESLCQRAILLSNGHMLHTGPVDTIVATYSNETKELILTDLSRRKDRQGIGSMRLTSFSYSNAITGDTTIASGKELEFQIGYEAQEAFPLDSIGISIDISNMFNQRLCTFMNLFTGDAFKGRSSSGQFRCYVRSLPLAPGQYKVKLWLGNGLETLDRVEDVATIEVVEADFFGTGKLPNIAKHGPILVPHQWKSVGY